MSNIEWTEATWNPIVGCSITSPGCTNCYAMTMAARLEAMGTLPQYAGTTQKTKGGPVWTRKLALAPEGTLLAPLRRRKPTVYFVNSMGDLFHEDVPDAWIDRVFSVMALAPQHTFQVLTKRSARMRTYLEHLAAADWQARLGNTRRVSLATAPGGKPKWPLPNVWLGVSAEDQKRADERIPDLLATPAAIRFVSAEPLLGQIDFSRLQEGLPSNAWLTWLDNIDWIIVGGESGPKARPMHPDWARSIRDQCAAAGTAFFFKQWGEWKNGSDFAADAVAVLNDGTVSLPTRTALEVLDREHPVPPRHPTMMRRVGKKRAGRLLDGVEHNAMPAAIEAEYRAKADAEDQAGRLF